MIVLKESVKNVNADYTVLSKSVTSFDQKKQFERVVGKLNEEWEQVSQLYQ